MSFSVRSSSDPSIDRPQVTSLPPVTIPPQALARSIVPLEQFYVAEVTPDDRIVSFTAHKIKDFSKTRFSSPFPSHTPVFQSQPLSVERPTMRAAAEETHPKFQSHEEKYYVYVGKVAVEGVMKFCETMIATAKDLKLISKFCKGPVILFKVVFQIAKNDTPEADKKAFVKMAIEQGVLIACPVGWPVKIGLWVSELARYLEKDLGHTWIGPDLRVLSVPINLWDRAFDSSTEGLIYVADRIGRVGEDRSLSLVDWDTPHVSALAVRSARIGQAALDAHSAALVPYGSSGLVPYTFQYSPLAMQNAVYNRALIAHQVSDGAGPRLDLSRIRALEALLHATPPSKMPRFYEPHPLMNHLEIRLSERKDLYFQVDVNARGFPVELSSIKAIFTLGIQAFKALFFSQKEDKGKLTPGEKYAIKLNTAQNKLREAETSKDGKSGWITEWNKLQTLRQKSIDPKDLDTVNAHHIALQEQAIRTKTAFKAAKKIFWDDVHPLISVKARRNSESNFGFTFTKGQDKLAHNLNTELKVTYEERQTEAELDRFIIELSDKIAFGTLFKKISDGETRVVQLGQGLQDASVHHLFGGGLLARLDKLAEAQGSEWESLSRDVDAFIKLYPNSPTAQELRQRRIALSASREEANQQLQKAKEVQTPLDDICEDYNAIINDVLVILDNSPGAAALQRAKELLEQANSKVPSEDALKQIVGDNREISGLTIAREDGARLLAYVNRRLDYAQQWERIQGTKGNLSESLAKLRTALLQGGAEETRRKREELYELLGLYKKQTQELVGKFPDNPANPHILAHLEEFLDSFDDLLFLSDTLPNNLAQLSRFQPKQLGSQTMDALVMGDEVQLTANNVREFRKMAYLVMSRYILANNHEKASHHLLMAMKTYEAFPPLDAKEWKLFGTFLESYPSIVQRTGEDPSAVIISSQKLLASLQKPEEAGKIHLLLGELAMASEKSQMQPFAIEQYHRCAIAAPKDSRWPAMIAADHVQKYQFAEAEKWLGQAVGISSEDPGSRQIVSSVINQHVSVQYRLTKCMLDAIELLTSDYMCQDSSRYVQALCKAVNLTVTVAKEPLFLRLFLQRTPLRIPTQFSGQLLQAMNEDLWMTSPFLIAKTVAVAHRIIAQNYPRSEYPKLRRTCRVVNAGAQALQAVHHLALSTKGIGDLLKEGRKAIGVARRVSPSLWVAGRAAFSAVNLPDFTVAFLNGLSAAALFQQVFQVNQIFSVPGRRALAFSHRMQALSRPVFQILEEPRFAFALSAVSISNFARGWLGATRIGVALGSGTVSSTISWVGMGYLAYQGVNAYSNIRDRTMVDEFLLEIHRLIDTAQFGEASKLIERQVSKKSLNSQMLTVLGKYVKILENLNLAKENLQAELAKVTITRQIDELIKEMKSLPASLKDKVSSFPQGLLQLQTLLLVKMKEWDFAVKMIRKIDPHTPLEKMLLGLIATARPIPLWNKALFHFEETLEELQNLKSQLTIELNCLDKDDPGLLKRLEKLDKDIGMVAGEIGHIKDEQEKLISHIQAWMNQYLPLERAYIERGYKVRALVYASICEDLNKDAERIPLSALQDFKDQVMTALFPRAITERGEPEQFEQLDLAEKEQSPSMSLVKDLAITIATLAGEALENYVAKQKYAVKSYVRTMFGSKIYERIFRERCY